MNWTVRKLLLKLEGILKRPKNTLQRRASQLLTRNPAGLLLREELARIFMILALVF